jgi:small subunit ribosomal protein S16
MAVRIRLRRMGRKKKPHYRVVVADRKKSRDGGFVENLGYYQPLTDPARVVLDMERVDYWLEQGAIPSHTVRNLVTKVRKGGDDSLVVGPVDQEEEKARKAEELAAKRKVEKETKAAEEKAAKEAEAEAAAKAKAEAEAAAKAKADAEAAAEAESAGDADEAEADSGDESEEKKEG